MKTFILLLISFIICSTLDGMRPESPISSPAKGPGIAGEEKAVTIKIKSIENNSAKPVGVITLARQNHEIKTKSELQVLPKTRQQLNVTIDSSHGMAIVWHVPTPAKNYLAKILFTDPGIELSQEEVLQFESKGGGLFGIKGRELYRKLLGKEYAVSKLIIKPDGSLDLLPLTRKYEQV
jgi:hypothetical protein